MQFWLDFLPLVIYILLIILLVIGIVLGFKMIVTMEKVEKVVNNVNEKVESLNSIFNIIDFTADKIVGVTDKVMEVAGNIVGKLFFRKKSKEKEE